MATLYSNACSDLNATEQYGPALAYCRAAVEKALQVQGPDGIDLAYASTNEGDALLGLQRPQEALPHYVRALRIHEKTGTEAEPNCVSALVGLSRVQMQTRQPLAAMASIERAFSLASKMDAAASDVRRDMADRGFELAQVLVRSGHRSERVLSLARHSLEVDRTIGAEPKARAIEEWAAAYSSGRPPAGSGFHSL